MRVAVAGGGIGGLATAVALRRAGVEVAVYERSPAGSGMGSGIGLWANALAVLEPTGISAQLTEGHVALTAGVLRDWRGRPLLRYPIGRFVPYAGIPFVAVTRPELHRALLRAAADRAIAFDTAITRFEQDQDGVSIELSDGSEERCDFLIGADGIRSRLREALFPGRHAYYTGWTVWQGIARMCQDEVGDSQTFQSLWSRDAAAMLMPMTPDLVFWFVSLRLPLRSEHALKPEDVDWEVARLAIERTPGRRLNRTALYESRPLQHWTSGRVALLGDAAHGMRPTLGMGGCQAIEDAFALARSLSRDPTAKGLRNYELARRRRANEMWWQSFMMPRLMNPQRPIPNWLRNITLKTLPTPILAAMFRRMLTPSTASLPAV